MTNKTPDPTPSKTPEPRASKAPEGNRNAANDRYANRAAGLVQAPSGGGLLTDARLQPPDPSPSSQFGLGPAASLPVTGMPFPVTPGSKDGTVTAEDTVKAFAGLGKSSPSLVAQIQKQLLLGGFYSNDYSPNYGVLNKDDLDAFAQLVGTAAKTGAGVQDYLGRQAEFGALRGVAAAIANRKQAKITTIQQEDPRALRSLIEKEFVSVMGRKPSAGEAAGFVSAFNAAYEHAQRANSQQQDAAIEPATDPQSQFYSDPTNFSTAPVPPTPGSAAAFRLAEEGPQAPFQPTMPDLPASATATPTPVEVQQQTFDAAAFAEDYARRTHPAEAGAHDITAQFSNFLDILKGIR